jgi:hypothetical protein
MLAEIGPNAFGGGPYRWSTGMHEIGNEQMGKLKTLILLESQKVHEERAANETVEVRNLQTLRRFYLGYFARTDERSSRLFPSEFPDQARSSCGFGLATAIDPEEASTREE